MVNPASHDLLLPQQGKRRVFGWKEKWNRRVPEMADDAIDEGILITGQSGFLTGTQVVSNLGWRSVEALSIGDKVLTFDHAMQQIKDIKRETLFMQNMIVPKSHRPVLVPEGALFNRRELWLMPDQGMLVECEAALDALGDPFAVIPARLLEGVRGIEAGIPGQRVGITTLTFEQDEAIYVEGGMLAHCPLPQPLLFEEGALSPTLYDVLDGDAARMLVEHLRDENDIRALASHPDELPSLKVKPVHPDRGLRI